MLRRSPARPEPASLPNTLTQLVNDALRAAALAPTANAALDVCGEALVRLAEVARTEVHHHA